MDVKKIVDELKKKYPGKNIIINTPENPTEIVCEVKPGSENPDRSVAVAVIDKSISHMHRRAKEVYEVIKGELEFNKGGRTYILHEGMKIEIVPGERHTAKGHETWVKVTSTPGWTPDDHILVE